MELHGQSNILPSSRTQGKTKRIIWGIVKQIGQLFYEKVPLPVPFLLFDVLRGKGLISQTPIPRGSLSYYGRLGATTTQGILRGTVATQGKDIVDNAQTALRDLVGGELPQEMNTTTIIAISCLASGSLFYWFMIKPGDIRQALRSKRETTSEDSLEESYQQNPQV